MLRGFRHTMFLLLQVGVAGSAVIAFYVRPDAWEAIAICLVGSLVASLACERIAARYLKRTLGQLRRAADDIGRGKATTPIEAQPGDDFYKLIKAINHMAARLAQASAEQQRLHEELRRRERLAFLGELAATVAHEVNNPLDGVQSCSRILRRSLDDAARAKQMLDLIDTGLERIYQIVRRLLTLAREHVVRPADARLSQLLDNALKAVAGKISERGIAVVREYHDGDDWARVDAPLLEQVFVNLMLNAADSMGDHGTLTLRLRRERGIAEPAGGDGAAGDDAVLCVEIEDTGVGIPAAALPHIFEPFYTTKQGGKGTGLGLAIAARIVDAHHGTIDVCSQEGRGAVFTIRLPSARSARAPREAGAGEALVPAAPVRSA